jgi:hypothetical protein
VHKRQLVVGQCTPEHTAAGTGRPHRSAMHAICFSLGITVSSAKLAQKERRDMKHCERALAL